MNIEVRNAKKEDFPFIIELSGQVIHHGIPKVRDVNMETVKAHMALAYQNISKTYESQNKLVILIAVDLDRNERVGFLTLVLDEIEGATGERQSFIHDLAVRKDCWGKYVVNKLMYQAEVETLKRGLHIITGSISVDNRRAFGTATKGLGYTLERYQIVKKI
jgi:ribosomal protein S18 acetylase RimI-like enzyme